MNILHVNQNVSVSGGGITRMIREFTPAMQARGHKVFAASAEQGIPSPDWLDGYDMVEELASRRSSVGHIRQLLDRWSIDVVHVHEVGDLPLLRFLNESTPTVVHLHNYSWWCPGTELFYTRTKEICPLSTGLHCVLNAYTRLCCNRHPSRLLPAVRNAYLRKKLYDSKITFVTSSDHMRSRGVAAGIPSDNIEVVPYAVRGARFEQTAAAFRPPVDSQYILYVGRISESKGIEYLLDAFCNLDTSVKLVIVGDGSSRRSVERRIEDLGIRSGVVMTGWLDNTDLAAAYRHACLVAVPSIWAEVFGIVGLEAMAAGRPVVAFDVGGISHWLINGDNGLLVQRADVPALVRSMQVILDDENLARKMGENGRQRFEKHFSVEVVVPRLLSVYDKSIADN